MRFYAKISHKFHDILLTKNLSLVVKKEVSKKWKN